MAKRSLVHIDLIKQVYLREAYVIQCFLAFSINCSENPTLRDFSLATPLKFGIGEQNAKDEQVVSLLKSDYTAWIAAVGFGQLADFLSLYLDDVYILLSMCGLVGGRRTNVLNHFPRFNKKSLNEKIKTIEDMYTLGSIYTDVISSMTKIRNWHRRKRCSQRARQGYASLERCGPYDHWFQIFQSTARPKGTCAD